MLVQANKSNSLYVLQSNVTFYSYRHKSVVVLMFRILLLDVMLKNERFIVQPVIYHINTSGGKTSSNITANDKMWEENILFL